MDFSVSIDHGVKIKEIEKTDKFLVLVCEMKKLGNIKIGLNTRKGPGNLKRLAAT